MAMNKWTGDCYGAANHYAMIHAEDWPRIRIVHANIGGRGPLAGRRLDHAWIEFDAGCRDQPVRLAFDPTVDDDGIAMPAVTYRSIADPRDVREYDPVQAMVLMLTTRHHGPWTAKERKKAKEYNERASCAASVKPRRLRGKKPC